MCERKKLRQLNPGWTQDSDSWLLLYATRSPGFPGHCTLTPGGSTNVWSGDGGLLRHSSERAEQQAAPRPLLEQAHADSGLPSKMCIPMEVSRRNHREQRRLHLSGRERKMLCPEQLLSPTAPFFSLCASSLGETSPLGPVFASPQQLSSGSLGTKNGYTNTQTAVAVMKAGGCLRAGGKGHEELFMWPKNCRD